MWGKAESIYAWNAVLMKLYVMGKKLGGHASQVAQWMQGIEIESLGREDPLEEGMATQSSALAWGTQWTEEPGGLQSMGLQSRTRPSESKAPAGVPLKTCVSQWQDCGELPFAFSFLQIFCGEQALLIF